MLTGSPPVPRDAATVLIIREDARPFEVFMLRRSPASPFVPDMFVFPGGSIDAQDALLARDGGLSPLEIAAIRESFEEAGILFASPAPAPDDVARMRAHVLAKSRSFADALAELGVRPDRDSLVPFSRWITPVQESRRFDARFYLARAPLGQVACADAYETHDGLWLSPREALDRNHAGNLAMIFPTIKHLERIAPFSSADELFAFARAKAIRVVQPDHTNGIFSIPRDLEDAW